MFFGKSIRTRNLQAGLIELCFDREGLPVNKFDATTLRELAEAVAAIAADPQLRGVLVTSGKDGFIAGADITEFPRLFASPETQISAFCAAANRAMNALEDLPVPTVVAINGFALGGGFELALSGDLRVMAKSAQVGFPEVKLGLIPGFGGTVRLSRVAGLAVALDWITSGNSMTSDAAKAAGVVTDVVEPDALRARAIALLEKAIDGSIDWRTHRARKLAAVAQSADAASAVIAKAAEKAAKAGINKHQPAPQAVIELMAHSVALTRDEALALEGETFAKVAKSQAAESLVQLFLSEQLLKKKSKEYAKSARPLRQAAVVGAGIMGGGIAYASAVRGTPVLLKDIQQKQIDIGVGEAKKILTKQVSGGRMDQVRADSVLAAITPRLDYTGFESVDIVVEAVVENIKVKHAVLSELEKVVGHDSIIASNTSSLRIDDLVQPLSRPENFIGMHFFNPAPVMPLVEVIRGEKTSAAAVSTVVGYAVAMGKTPIVVKDGAGFLVNRILTPYMLGFIQLVRDGVDFARIDGVMERFGWPMGPAYLNDVIGMDTGTHVFDVICEGFPHRLKRVEGDAVRLMKEHGRLGQKNGVGFYKYETDPAGKPKKIADPQSYELLKSVQKQASAETSDQEIIERMMVPMIVEAAWCLEEAVVETPNELDMALLLGLGLPKYLGGILKYADWLGLAQVVALSDRYAVLGEHYVVPASLRQKAESGQRFYA